jgi:ATP-binding protein involved in chromosome partitioning
MARRSFLRVAGVIENMSHFTCEHGTVHPLFGEGGGATLANEIGAELLGQVPIETAVASGSDSGEPVALSGSSAAAEVFRDIAKKIVAATVPVTEMAGCSARLLESVEIALGKKPR